jgi:hypothetical protein
MQLVERRSEQARMAHSAAALMQSSQLQSMALRNWSRPTRASALANALAQSPASRVTPHSTALSKALTDSARVTSRARFEALRGVVGDQSALSKALTDSHGSPVAPALKLSAVWLAISPRCPRS